MASPSKITFPAPAHIVLFNKNDGLKEFLRQYLDDLGQLSEATVSGLPGTDGLPSIKVFEHLDAVAASLDETQLLTLDKYGATAFANQRCSLPHFRIEGPKTTFALASTDTTDLPASVHTTALTWALRSIGVTEDYRYSGKGVKVAVLDTGVDRNHPDLVHALSSENLRSFVSGEDVDDQNGHGTHCAGIVAGIRNSCSEMTYAVSPGATLMIAKVFDSYGTSTDDVILSGIDWASSAGARIISMSFESHRYPDTEPTPLYRDVALRLMSRGTLMVAAAGNKKNELDALPVSNPAACEGIIGVASLDEYGRVYGLCRGATDSKGKVDIAAPGVRIHSAWLHGTFKDLTGTSMATPHVAGAAALYLEAFPNLSAAQLSHLILERAVPSDKIPPGFGRGSVTVP